MNRKNLVKRLLWIVFGLFLSVNIVAFNHAYRFTHFAEYEGQRQRPEYLSKLKMLRVLLLGIDNPRPKNRSSPKRAFETISLNSHETLEAWHIKADKPIGTIVMFHGYGGSKSALLTYEEEFNKMGYSTLLVDFMSSGGSKGNATTIGYKESMDVKVAYEYIRSLNEREGIVLFGSSMGAVSIMKAIEKYKIEPDRIILECPFGTFKKTVNARFRSMGVPSLFFDELLMFYGGIQHGFNAFKHNPVQFAEHIEVPTLLMHGKRDRRVSVSEIEEIFENLQGEKKLKIFEDSGHENYLDLNRIEWRKEVSAFLKD